MLPRRASFLAGLFLVTLATLLLELLNTRLLSVVTWYHLSFFAVSTAMFGMSAGAIRVYLGGDAFEGEAGRRALARWSGWLALAIPLSHIVVLCTPIQLGTSAVAIAGLAWTTVAIAAPFFISGVVVAIALTRVPGPPGLVYAVDPDGRGRGRPRDSPAARASGHLLHRDCLRRSFRAGGGVLPPLLGNG